MIQPYFKPLLIFQIVLILAGCAYFNTFYNANVFFDEAEQLREEKNEEKLSRNILDKYRSVVSKCDIVLTKYPKSRYVGDAHLLKGKAQYHLGDYVLAENEFNILLSINAKKYSILSEYWLALIKWKKGRPQPALNDLDALIAKIDNNKQLAKYYESKASIYLELEQDDEAMFALGKAAELTKNSIDKGNIYYELALLADKSGSYENAIINYENAINYSYSQDRILESHLRIVQLHRDLDQFEEASTQIASMLIKPNFSSIYAELNLELAKLELAVNNNADGINILDDIVVNFPKTEVSAEAFYLLGNEYLFNIRNFLRAEYYYQQIQKEFNRSIFKPTAEIRLNEINQYNLSKSNLETLIISEINPDSVESAIDTIKIVGELYNLGELEAFHFNELDTSLIYFNQIIDKYPGSVIESKVLYTLSIINQKLGNANESINYEKQLISEYPNSEFADYIRVTSQNPDYGKSSFNILQEAESLYLLNQDLALSEYKQIAFNSSPEVSARAMLFIAYDYENRLFLADSSEKYYKLLIERYPLSDQAIFAQNKLNDLDLVTEESAE